MTLWKLPFEWMREYPQTWYYMPRNKWLREKLQKLCGEFMGHEGSKTEWGYGGGDFVDNNCRWCDFVLKISKNQYDGGKEFNTLIRDFKFEVNFESNEKYIIGPTRWGFYWLPHKEYGKWRWLWHKTGEFFIKDAE